MRRRQILQSLGGLMAAATLRPVRASRAQESTDITGRLARYMVDARDRELPSEVVLAAKHRILDTFGAIVSGAQLKPGEMAIRYVRAQGGIAEASVPTTNTQSDHLDAVELKR